MSPSGDLISISVPVAMANSLLDTEFSVFKHEETDKHMIRALSYSLPSYLFEHIEFVHPVVEYVVHTCALVKFSAVFPRVCSDEKKGSLN